MPEAAVREPHLRPATAADAERLWAWRNNAATRRGSFDEEAVPWETHVRWLEARLGEPTSELWILEVDGVPAGQARVDREDGTGEISFALAPEFRGRGLGPVLLDLAVDRCTSAGLASVVGLVKPDNDASVKTFERAGFERAGGGTRSDGQPFVRFERRCAE